MKKITSIEGAQIRLEPITLDFVSEEYRAWLNDPEVFLHLATSHYTLQKLREYVADRIQRGDVFFWAILDKATKTHIGNVKLEPVNWDTKTAIFGIMIGNKNFWGRGIATEATVLVSDFSLIELGLERIDLGVKESNVAAFKAYQRAGFELDSVESGMIKMKKLRNKL